MAKLRLLLENTATLGIVFIAAVGATGCTSTADADTPVPHENASSTERAALVVGGTRETLVDSIASIENSAFTATGRLFVTGDDGIYEITRDATGTPGATVRAASNGCKFAGIAETHGVLYVNCYDGTNSSVFAAALDQTPSFQKIYDLPGVGLANGAAADDAGRLYVADSLHGNLFRLSIDGKNPFTVTSREAFSTGNVFPNGLKFFGGSIYYTDFFAVKRIPLLADGSAGTVATLTTQLTFFDDLHVDDGGILVANYLFGTAEGLTTTGVDLLDTVAFGFSGPSSVLPAKGRFGLSDKDVLVTEKGANRLSVFHLR
jgi:hypothetical protein